MATALRGNQSATAEAEGVERELELTAPTDGMQSLGGRSKGAPRTEMYRARFGMYVAAARRISRSMVARGDAS